MRAAAAAAAALQSGNSKKSAPTATSISTKVTQQMKQHQQQAQQKQHQPVLSTSNKQLKENKMSFIIVSLLALLVSISAFSARSSDAKPLNQNQVKFRRLPPREFSALLGSSITIECEASSSPPPTIHWLKNGKKIQQTHALGGQLDENSLDDGQQPRGHIPVDDVNRIALSSTRSRLFIDCASDDDEATYTCVAENTYSRVASNTKLNLIRPLLMATGGADNNLLASGGGGAGSSESSSALGGAVAAAAAAADLQEADSANLSAMPQCLSQRSTRSAEPARIHMWTHNIVEIMKNDVVLYCRSNINRRQQQQQQMTRGQQEAIAAAMAAVAPVEQTLSDLISNKLAPKSSSSAASAAQTAAVVAAAAENTQPDISSSKSASVSWTLPDEKLVSQEHKDKFEILETGDLLVKDLRWEDMGSYVCTVSNELGSDSVSTFVYPASVKSVKSKRATAFKAD